MGETVEALIERAIEHGRVDIEGSWRRGWRVRVCHCSFSGMRKKCFTSPWMADLASALREALDQADAG